MGTTSYAAVRRAVAMRQLPDKNAVRIEELVNFFPYDYTAPTGKDDFAAHIEIAACPWRGSLARTLLMRSRWRW